MRAPPRLVDHHTAGRPSTSIHHPSHNPYSEASRFSHSNPCSADASRVGIRGIPKTGGPYARNPYTTAPTSKLLSVPPQLPSQVKVTGLGL